MSYPVIFNENLAVSIDFARVTPTLVSLIEHLLDEHGSLLILTRLGRGYTSLRLPGIDDYIMLSERNC